MKFFEALNIAKQDVISLVGAGGKTTTMFALGEESVQKGLKTILTTTTKIFYPTTDNLKVITSSHPLDLSNQIEAAFAENNLIVVGKHIDSSNKLWGLDTELFKTLVDSDADVIIVEADGSARKPFKAPAEHEPVIPKESTIVMPILGIDSLGKTISSEHVHRPEYVVEMTGLAIGELITPEVMSVVLTSTLGYRKGLPPKARWIPFINKVESPVDLVLARQIAQQIRREVPTKVLIGAATQADPIEEVIEA